MAEYIAPIRKILNNYKKGIHKIKQQNNLIQNAIEKKENDMNYQNIMTKRNVSSSIEKLDKEIQQLSTKIKKNIR